MFEKLDTLPADPILGLNQTYQQDSNADKINLSIGVYQNAEGLTPIFTAVKRAEQQLISAQKTKSYAPQAGDPAFLEHMSRLMLGDQLVDELAGRLAAVMTPGGCGALRMGAELLMHAKSGATLWVSDPTWANHYPLLESAGLSLKKYDYYSPTTHTVDFAAMLDSLQQIPVGDIVLLHGCCHNPTGADISAEQWDQVIDVLLARQLLPFIDVAYQGFGDGLQEDAYGVRESIRRLPEVLVASSCSKNFGLYRERIGAVMVITPEAAITAAAKSHILTAARSMYSMSPFHGGGIVGHLLSDADLTAEWKTELEQVRLRMHSLRLKLASGLNQAQSEIDFTFIEQSKGMFCYLGIPLAAVHALRAEFGIYLLDSTRINVAGLSEQNLPVIVDRVTQVVTR